MAKPILLIIAILLVAPLAVAQKKTTCTRCKQVYDQAVKQYQGRRLREVLHIAASRAGVRMTTAGHKAAQQIVFQESGGNPNMRNPRSTSRGLFGLLRSTGRSVGVPHVPCPYCQSEGGLRYIKQRYGSAEKAWSFWKRNKWY